MITILIINVFVKMYDILLKYICKYLEIRAYQYLHVLINNFNPVIYIVQRLHWYKCY